MSDFFKKLSLRVLPFYMYGFALILVLLPFSKNYSSHCITLTGVIWLFANSPVEKLQHLLKRRWFLAFLLYYSIHLFSVFHSDDLKVALFILEKKTGILVLPLILLSGPKWTRKQIDALLLLFVGVVSVGQLICLVHGIYLALKGDYSGLFYEGLSKTIGMHPVYWSYYTYFSSCIAVYFLLRKSKAEGFLWLRKSYLWMIIVFLTGMLFLLASKAVLVLSVFTVLGMLIHLLRKNMTYGKQFVAAIMVIIVLGAMAYLTPPIKNRFNEIFYSDMNVLKQDTFRYDTEFTGLTLRLQIARLSFEQLSNDNAWVFGVGTGDAQHRLDTAYAQCNMYTGNPELGDRGYLGYNAHNQYIQALLETGVVGLFALLIMLFIALFRGEARNNYLLVILVLFLAFSGLSESFLETHSGSVFFAFFLPLLVLKGEKEVVPAV